MARQPDVAYVLVLGGEQGEEVLARVVNEGYALDPSRLLTEARRLRLGLPVDESEGIVHFSKRITDSSAESSEELLLGEGLDGGEVSTKGYVVVGLSEAGIAAAKRRLGLQVLWVAAAGIAVFLLLSWIISRHFIERPLNEMKETATAISHYDLTRRAEKYSDDEVGEVAEALNRIGENLRAVLSRVMGVTESLNDLSARIATTSEIVARGAVTTATSVDQTSSSMQEMLATLKGIAENVEVLAQSAEESSSSILEMAATNDEVAQNIEALAASVEETTTAIEQMTYSIKEVAKNIEDLSATAEETSSSMNEMDVSISQVETNANETARLSEQVSQDARTAGEALQKTIEGIDKIRESSETAARVIETLGQKISTIGKIILVIDDVAEQTNLLALNAAIIAAQAGEHGKGFAVVADEIKDLAERTGASTKEIADLIRSVQEESKNAIAAMERGVRSVDEGVRLSGEADKALKQILQSANQSTQMVKAIARATVEQSRGSKQVTSAITRIAETVQEIARATGEQARGSEQIMKSAEKMKIITKHVERSSQEQARGSRQITQAIASISDMVQQLNLAQKEQTRGAEQVLFAVENIKEVTTGQSEAVRDLERAIETLAEQAEVLRAEVQQFKV
ncbi:MAG: methyl-accepting chemotaxis protein [Deltaproteobacteria bacterium]|nr:MAG: methyl-accepting chemotaxis protein [Deltaproteobacteria bacterium]